MNEIWKVANAHTKDVGAKECVVNVCGIIAKKGSYPDAFLMRIPRKLMTEPLRNSLNLKNNFCTDGKIFLLTCLQKTNDEKNCGELSDCSARFVAKIRK